MVTKEDIWDLLSEIPDPEIPAISIVELGVVRKVDIVDNKYFVSITPTYSGCPALNRMENDIKKELSKYNIDFEIKTQLFPPWTTDWMSQETKDKLENFGISPPTKIVKCPQCKSSDVELISFFASTACKSMYKCNSCLEPFDHFKCI